MLPMEHLRLELFAAMFTGVDKTVWKMWVLDVIPDVPACPARLSAHLAHEPVLTARRVLNHEHVQSVGIIQPWKLHRLSLCLSKESCVKPTNNASSMLGCFVIFKGNFWGKLHTAEVTSVDEGVAEMGVLNVVPDVPAAAGHRLTAHLAHEPRPGPFVLGHICVEVTGVTES